jgi:hypothetical protein
VTLEVDYPYRESSLDKSGYVRDMLFADTGSSWEHHDTMIEEATGVLMPAMTFPKATETLARWTFNGGSWKISTPILPGRKPYIHQYNVSALVSTATYNYNLEAEPMFTLWVYRYVPTTAASALWFKWGDERCVLNFYETQPPTFSYNGVVVSQVQLTRNEATQLGQAGEFWIQVLTLAGKIIITSSLWSQRWIAYERTGDDWEFGPSPIAMFAANAGSLMLNLARPVAQAASYAIEKEAFVLKPWINPTLGAIDKLHPHIPAGCSITPTLETLGEGFALKIAFACSGNETPYLGGIQEKRDTLLKPGVSNAIDLSDRVDRITVQLSRNHRDDEATITLRDPDHDLALKGNEYASVKLGWGTMIGGVPGTEEATVLTGFVTDPEIKRAADSDTVDIRVKQRTIRLEKKPTFAHPQYDKVMDTTAVRDLLLRANVKESLINVSGVTPWELPGGLPEKPRWKFDRGMSTPSALDAICAVSGREWGIDEYGVVYYRDRLEDTTATITLIDSVIAQTDMITDVSMKRDMESIRNVTFAIGMDPATGELVGSIYRDDDSIDVPSADNYIGDDFWQVLIDPAFMSSLICQNVTDFVGPRAAATWKIVEWNTMLRPTIHVDDIVAVETSYLGVAFGTKFRIIQGEHTLERSDDGKWKAGSRFVGEVIYVPA